MLGSLLHHTQELFGEEHIQQFHSILATLEEASGEDLSYFRIADKKVRKFGAVSECAIEYDPDYVRSKLRSLSDYLSTLWEGRPIS